MAGISNQVLYGSNVDFTGTFPVSGQINQDGELLIGSSVAPNIRSGTLTGSGGIVITNGPGTIDIDGSGISGGVTSVSGTANRITSTGGATPVINIAPTYVGQTSITTLGTIATGVWNGTTVTVPFGGTGTATNTNHGVLIGQGSSAIAATTAGTSGQVLQSQGAASDPTWTTATFPSTATATGTILRANGTNWVASTPTYPNAASTAGKVVVSDGTNLIMSTPTFPNASATSGKIIKSDGTNWVASTETYAAPGTSGNVMTSDGTNWTSATPSAGITLIWVSTTVAGPLDGITYYFSNGQSFNFSTTGVASSSIIYITQACTITKCYGAFAVTGTLGSNENCTLAIRKNGTTDTNISTTIQLTANPVTFNNTGLSISLAAGDYVQFKFVSPTWGTNPTSVSFSGCMHVVF